MPKIATQSRELSTPEQIPAMSPCFEQGGVRERGGVQKGGGWIPGLGGRTFRQVWDVMSEWERG